MGFAGGGAVGVGLVGESSGFDSEEDGEVVVVGRQQPGALRSESAGGGFVTGALGGGSLGGRFVAGLLRYLSLRRGGFVGLLRFHLGRSGRGCLVVGPVALAVGEESGGQRNDEDDGNRGEEASESSVLTGLLGDAFGDLGAFVLVEFVAGLEEGVFGGCEWGVSGGILGGDEAATRTAALNIRQGTTRARDRPWRALVGPTLGVYVTASPSASDVVGGAVCPVPIIAIAVNNSSTTRWTWR